MREIKFRAWDKETDQMIHNFGLTPDDYFPYQLPDDDCESPEDPANYKYYEDAILMQYTSLKDKNGTEIYEGDIVAVGIDLTVPQDTTEDIETDNLVCSFKHGMFMLEGDVISGTVAGIQDKAIRFEVIGNIYENKELLT